MKKAVIFDLDDTLYRIVDAFQAAIFDLKIDLKGTCINELYKSFRKESEVLFSDSQSGLISMEKMRTTRIIKSLSNFGIDINEIEGCYFQERYEYHVSCLRLPSDVVEILDYLKNREVPIGIITNGESTNQWNKINSLGILEHFNKDHIIVSGDIGVDKPNPAIFKEMAKIIDADTYYYIGDSHSNDILGSFFVGWKNIWLTFNSPTESSFATHLVSNYDELKKAVFTLF